MNAKIKLIAAIAALQIIVPTVFANPPPLIPGAAYEIMGRVIQVTPRMIMIRSRGPNAGDWIIMRREDTRFYAQIKPGDMINIKYNMMATDVSLVSPVIVSPRRR